MRATTDDLLAGMIILASTLCAKGDVLGVVWGNAIQKRFSLLPGVKEEGERKEEKDPNPQLSP